MAFVVLYDSCVLYPAPLRDLLVRLADTGVVRARWSEPILDECFRSILAKRKDLRPEALARTRELMKHAVPDCIVTGFDGLIDALKLPDPNDRHVLAAAIQAGAQAIITFNLKHFPDKTLRSFHIEAVHPDDFVLNTIDLSPGAIMRVLTEQASVLRKPPQSVAQLLDTLIAQGLVQSVARVRGLFGI